MGKMKGSHKAYQARLICIYGKMEELDLMQPATEETTNLVVIYS